MASTIPLEVDDATARAFSLASTEEKRKMQMLLKLRLRELAVESPKPLKQVMDEISESARKKGLTEEELESLLG